ncbi:hypothetical protein C1J00_39295, partial [Streptomyces cahuitamycinicus]
MGTASLVRLRTLRGALLDESGLEVESHGPVGERRQDGVRHRRLLVAGIPLLQQLRQALHGVPETLDSTLEGHVAQRSPADAMTVAGFGQGVLHGFDRLCLAACGSNEIRHGVREVRLSLIPEFLDLCIPAPEVPGHGLQDTADGQVGAPALPVEEEGVGIAVLRAEPDPGQFEVRDAVVLPLTLLFASPIPASVTSSIPAVFLPAPPPVPQPPQAVVQAIAEGAPSLAVEPAASATSPVHRRLDGLAGAAERAAAGAVLVGVAAAVVPAVVGPAPVFVSAAVVVTQAVVRAPVARARVPGVAVTVGVTPTVGAQGVA